MSEHTTPAGPVAALIDGGDMDCGSGLLLLITRAMRRLHDGQYLGVRSAEPSVVIDLPAWAELAGHGLVDQVAETPDGPWWFSVSKGAGGPRSAPITLAEDPFSQGERTPVGQRLWVYTNFDCNLACEYCCAQSSPKAPARRMPVDLATQAFAEFAELGGQEVYFTGGEPFMHPELDRLIDAARGFDRTILTNAMIVGRGRRREMLEELDRDVVLQISLDSATPQLHDSHRGAGSWSKALAGIELANGLGFRVRVAATLYPQDIGAVTELHARLNDLNIPEEDRLIRPVAEEGYAESGVHVSLDTVEPEPTITADGAWWHPVAVTNPNLQIGDAPLPLSEIFGVVTDALAVQDAAAAEGREVFRCA